MRNKGIIITLTVVITALCLYYLSFTFVSRGIQNDAIKYATGADGKVNAVKKQVYLDSLWNKPVYNLLGKEYTYKDIKGSEISLGLDLQGGMHVTLEVSPVGIVRGLANNSNDSSFVKALNKTVKAQKTSPKNFGDLFFETYRKDNPGKKLAPIFANATTRGRLSINDTDDKVMEVVNQEIEGAIDRSYTILRNRLDQFGTSSPNIQRLQGGKIQIEIPGADNPQRVRKLLSGAAVLEFWEIVEPSDPALNQSLMNINQMLLAERNAAKPEVTDTKAKVEETTPGDSTLSDLEKQLNSTKNDTSKNSLDSLANVNLSPLLALSNPGYPFLYDVKDTAQINRILKREDVRAKMPRSLAWFWDVKAEPNITPGIEDLRLNFVRVGRNGKALLSGEVVSDARLDYDQFGRPSVSMKMNAAGSKTWAKVTAAEAAKAPQGRIAIVLDNYVYTAPTVNGEIPNGNSQITGSFSIDEAKDLANILKAGSLPAPTKIVEEASVGPTLGQESIRNGLISIVVGFVIIIVFMIAVYSTAGWVADLAVVLNLIFLLGVLASLNAALTLPGIAGILLSLAIAVDANVLINERVKEDLASGKSFEAAIAAGYKNAFSAIIDSNVTTLIKGFVLLIFGTGLIYGFAVTLIIGIICSFFTSVFFTRILFEFYVRRGKTIGFSMGWSKDLFRSIKIDFIGNRKIYYTISLTVIIAGMVMLAVKGFNYGVDFKGGRSYVVQLDTPVSSSDLRESLEAPFEGASVEVKTFGSDSKYKITTSYLIDDDSEEATAKSEHQLHEGLAKLGTNKSEILSSAKVGPTIANDIKISAVWSLTIATALMFLYILIRFRRWQFALGTVVSIVHTVLFVLAVFVLLEDVMPFSLEIDQAFIAAILTVIGYSINDSVVVFDRVREFLNLKKAGESTAVVVNRALNDTLSRTLITGMSTIFVIIILFVFGGETIKGFTFAMLIGVLIGTYASLCIGTPVLVDFSKDVEKEPATKTPGKAVTA
ncbi:MAG: protein translocase subunit SecDF [Azospira oryzae]|jgi:SecD/SecF fusion protein|nr:MAG: protein translocase subunit SecDF [Azospira oryzae]